jgi:predicted O-linked N-acetylglucosamine transferase (SPINDLY family)
MTYLGLSQLHRHEHHQSPHQRPPCRPTGNERWHSESLIRLPSAFFCYRAHDEAPQITPLPALKSGHITFACLQTYPKITDRMLQIWSQILALSPQSRLLILAPADAEDRIRGALPFSDRVEIAPRLSLAKYYELFSRIDIALDTFPYNGHTTTCDCLWMGVPVVTLSGVAAVSRAGVSVLNNVGLPELIATSPEAYVSAAVSLAGDPNRLAELRATLRERMSQSPIMNGKLITQDLENAYTQMWAQRCGSR